MSEYDDPEVERLKREKIRSMMENRASGKPVKLTSATFKEGIQNKPLVVIDCWAPWCAPCRMIAPVIEELARDYAGKILFGKLNVDENKDVALQYQIMSIPTLLIFKNERLVDRITGAMPRQLLEPKIVRHL